jgi:sarcosine oxidase subunit gamma
MNMGLSIAEKHPERAPLVHRDAVLLDIGHTMLVSHYRDTENLGECGLADFTNLPRLGARGKAAAGYLAAAGLRLPETPNRLILAASGETLLRLSQSEYLLLGSPADKGARVRALETAFPRTGENGLYFLPRQDSHAWFRLAGPRRFEVMAKLCGVDLRPAAFARDGVAQTSVARINAIVANDGATGDGGQNSAFHLLFDRPSAPYLWDVLLDAMREFGGQPLGFRTLAQ